MLERIIFITAYRQLQNKLKELEDNYNSKKVFQNASKYIWPYIERLSRSDYLNVLKRIGELPESVRHDSTEEKTYAKISDMVFARGVQEIGLKGRVLTERADAGDIVGTSKYFHYSLVGDSKISRLSRTARNQKDFKVEGLNNWRYNHDFAVLCSPYFDYPDRKSQVYESAIARNVSLFTWEYIIFLIKNNIVETPKISLKPIWDYSNIYRKRYFSDLNFNSKKKLSRAMTKKVQQRFLDDQSTFINNYARKIYQGHNFISFDKILKNQRKLIMSDAKDAKSYWDGKIDDIKQLSKDEAIRRLIKQSKITNKIAYINRYLRRINNEKWKNIFRRFQ